MTKTYQEIISENNKTGQFNDAKTLTDFLENYCNDLTDKEWPTQVRDQEDNISEYAEKITPEVISALIRHETPAEDAYVKEIK